MSTMDKFSKRTDPLRARPLRIEKPRRAHRGSRTQAIRKQRAVNAYNFDEDISEVKKDKEQEFNKQDCECDGNDPECDCQLEDDNDMDEDDMSERSYNESDADCC
jgi:hypothetical protein